MEISKRKLELLLATTARTAAQEAVDALINRTTAPIGPPAVMTPIQASACVGAKNPRALKRWRLAWRVPVCANGRCSRTQLDMGLESEARGVRQNQKAA